MAVTIEMVKMIAPELETETDDRIEFFMDMAADLVSESKFDTKYDKAMALMTCHLLTISNRRGISGAVTKERTADIETTYASGSGKPDGDLALNQTSYGMMFKKLRDAMSRGPLVV